MPIVWRYNRRVGTGVSHKISGGVFGRGISNNIRELYAAIANIYEPGDELFFFGFSRGAFTARSLVGLITVCGLLRSPTPGSGRFDPGSDLVNKAYDAYRDRGEGRKAAHEFQRDFAWPVESLSLRFMGVWDTVGSLGIPAIGLRTLIARRLWAFHDTDLNCFVREAYQALAIGEHRTPFPATLWQVKSPEEEGTPEKAELRRTQRVEQRWFTGCHSEVGGNRGELAWRWMMEKASATGLAFNPPLAERPAPDAFRRYVTRWTLDINSVVASNAPSATLPSPSRRSTKARPLGRAMLRSGTGRETWGDSAPASRCGGRSSGAIATPSRSSRGSTRGRRAADPLA